VSAFHPWRTLESDSHPNVSPLSTQSGHWPSVEKVRYLRPNVFSLGALMTLSDLAALGSFISGFAVLISLIFLYFQLRQVSEQVRQSEKNQRALMNQGSITRVVDTLKWAPLSGGVDLRVQVMAGKTDLSAEEIFHLARWLRMMLLNGQDAYVQHKSGLADQITFDASINQVHTMMAQPVYRAVWKMRRTSFAPEWMAYVDRLIETTPLTKSHDDVAMYKSALARVLS